MRSREASTGRDRAVEEPLLTPKPGSCPSLSLLLIVSRKRHESAMNSVMNRVRGRGGSNSSAASGTGESHQGRVLCLFDFSRANSLRILYDLPTSSEGKFPCIM
jgi:hypothetical protein